MLEVTGAICGLHAQLMSSAELSAWARVEDLEPDAVSRALWEERTLVKTWAMRGTLHLLPTVDYPLWQAGLSTRERDRKPSWYRGFGIGPEELETLTDAVAQALDGRALTRVELADEVTAITGSPALGEQMRGSWGAMLKPASFRGHLCFAPSVGQNVRFTRPDGWLGASPPVDPDAALLEITRRFLAAHGPATREDLARWWGVSPAAGGKMISRLGEDAIEVGVEGTPAWMLTADVTEAAAASPPGSIRLVPAFDPYVIAATRHAIDLMPGDFKDRVYRPQGWLSPVLLVDGRMEGVWRQERRGGRLVVEIEPFRKQPVWVRKAAGEEAERLAAFTGGALKLTWPA